MIATMLVCAAAAGGATVPWWAVGAIARGPGVPAAEPVRAVTVDRVLLLDVVDAALAAGAPIPRALQVVGAALGGADGDALARAGSALVLGASWPSAWAGASPAAAPLVETLEPAWSTGAAPGPALRARADQLRRERRTRSREAAATLGVHLVLPLGLCFLPAFVLLGLVPLVLSLASGLLGVVR